jgi:acetyl esterase/lipase
MPSWQAGLIKLIFRVRRLMNPLTGELDVAQSRRDTESLALFFRNNIESTCTPVDAGGVPAEWVLPPAGDERRVILYLHGGAYNCGSIISHRGLAATFAQAACARALLLDYRLAPEHPYPAAVEDAVSAYRWLRNRGVDPDQIAVAGDSAGGGLVLALALSLRDAGEPLPAALVCLSPWVDLAMTCDSWITKTKSDLILDPGSIAQSAEIYLNGADPQEPLASPLYGDLHGLPPILIQIGSDEFLVDEATLLAEKTRAVGVDTTLEIYNGMQHEWHFTAGMVPEAKQAVDQIGNFIRLHCQPIMD